MANVTLVDQIGGTELKALVATNDGAGNNIATQIAARIEGVATTDYPAAPTKVAVYTRANLPTAANRDATTIYLVKEEA